MVGLGEVDGSGRYQSCISLLRKMTMATLGLLLLVKVLLLLLPLKVFTLLLLLSKAFRGFLGRWL